MQNNQNRAGDQTETFRFLNSLGCKTETTRFRTFDDAKRGGIIPQCYASSDFQNLSQENDKGAGVFVVVNETLGDKDADVIGIRAVFVDLDGAPLETVTDNGLAPHITVESSPGRYHVYWKVKECPLEYFTPFQKAIAGRFNGDKSVVNLSRVMRLPGFFHQKAASFLTRILRIDDREPYTPQEIVAGLQLASLLDAEPSKAQKRQQVTGNRPGDDYNRRASWAELLKPHGWTLKHTTKDGRELWNKPGHSGQQSATVNYAGSDFLYCFSDSAGLPQNEGLSKFAVYTHFVHAGDFPAAASALAKQGYGIPAPFIPSITLSATPEQSKEWPEPSPLPDGLPPVKLLDPVMIPAPLRGWLVDITTRMQIPPDFSTAAVTVALGSIIGRGCGVHPKRHDDWIVIPNLWGAAVGRPSLMKTPAITEAQRHLVRLETEARKEYQTAAQAYEVDKEVMKATKSIATEELKKAVKAGTSIDEARAKLEALQKGEPVRRRYQTQDGTTEKIGELLNQNPRGLLVNRDELIGWFRSLDRDGRENDRGFYLEAWNGTGGYTYDRIGRGTLDIPALCVSVFGAITPGPLSAYSYQAQHGGNGDDGLLQRFQVLVWPDAPGEWINIDRFPDTKEKNRAWEIFKKLAGDIPGAATDEGADIPALRFSPSGQEVFDSWRHKLETRLRSDHGFPPAMESHLAKYRSLMPSLALIFHLVEVADGTEPPGPVSERVAIMAVAWCEYLETHAWRVYGASTAPGMVAAREIIKHIKRGEVTDGCNTWALWRPQWSRLTTSEEVKAGLEVLQEYDWLIVEKAASGERGGRPAQTIHLNPKIFLKP